MNLSVKPEQGVLAGTLGVIAVIFIVLSFMQEEASQAGGEGKQKAPEKIDLAPYAKVAETLAAHPSIPSTPHRTFVSRLIGYDPEEGVIKYVDPKTIQRDKIEVQWKIDHGFPLDDPTVATADPDQDGFTNKEEFDGKTNPKEASSSPLPLFKLRVVGYNFEPFFFILKGYNPDPQDASKYIYQVNMPKRTGRKTEYLRTGDEIEGYKVGEFRQIKKMVFSGSTNAEIEKDLSELDMIYLKLNEKTTLVLNQQLESEQSTVDLKLGIPGFSPEPSKVARGDVFKIKDRTYQVLQLERASETIVIQDQQTKEKYRVTREAIEKLPAS